MAARELLVHDDRVQASHPALTVAEAAQIPRAQVSSIVLIGERPAPKHGDARDPEIIRTDQMHLHRGALVRRWLRLAFDEKRGLPRPRTVLARRGEHVG